MLKKGLEPTKVCAGSCLPPTRYGGQGILPSCNVLGFIGGVIVSKYAQDIRVVHRAGLGLGLEFGLHPPFHSLLLGSHLVGLL